MRIWDVNVSDLCRKHLLGEHRELHGLWNILTIHNSVGGYSNHPETKRWVGKLRALYNRHQDLVLEMQKRGFNHKTDLNEKLASGFSKQDFFINTIDEQKILLKNKRCNCYEE